eukprot:409384_1
MFGGYKYPQNEYIFDVNKDIILSTNQVSTSIQQSGCSQTYVEIKKLNQSMVYFSDLVSTTNSFYRFNITASNKVIEQIGSQYPKPDATNDECFTTDKINRYIYVIGGSNGNSQVRAFQIFDTLTNKWSQGPSLNQARAGGGCMCYKDKSDGNEYLYAFGDGTTTIEMLAINGNNKWTIVASLTYDMALLFAFQPQTNANYADYVVFNIVYIIGFSIDTSAGYFICDIFSLDSNKIQHCDKYPQYSLNGFGGEYIRGSNYNSFKNRFYLFGGYVNDGMTNYIEYAILCSSFVNLNKSSNTIT